MKSRGESGRAAEGCEEAPRDGEKWRVLADKVGAHVCRLHKVGKAGRGRLQGLKVGSSGHGEQGRVLRDQIEDRHEHEVFALEEIEELVRGGGRGHPHLRLKNVSNHQQEASTHHLLNNGISFLFSF